MATILEYANEVAKYVGNGAKVQEIPKANGVTKVGITVNQGRICPTVYIDQMYEEGIPAQQAAAMVMDIAEKNRVEGNFDIEKFLDYDGFVKPRLRIRLYNKATEAEVKRSAASRGFKDLIIVPYVDLPDFNGGGSIKIKKEHVKEWGVTEKEVIDTALKNSADDVVVKDLFGMVQDMMDLNLPTDGDNTPLYVSNKAGNCGASAILGLLPSLKKKYKNGFFVLPSSIHEVLVMPSTGNEDIDLLTAMVQDVNATQVLPEERLADMAFGFGV